MGILSAALLLAGLAVGPAAETASIWRHVTWTDLDGRAWTAPELEGRVVVVDFWATWCPPCLAEIPNLQRLARRFGDRDFVLVGVALDTIDRRRLRSFLLRHEISWPQVHVPEGTGSATAKRFAVEAVPVTLVVDRHGRPVARDLRGRALELSVETLIGLGDAGGRGDS